MKLKFTVILPIYKKVEYKVFRKSFESLINQTLQPNEIIIIFDGPVKNNIKDYLIGKVKVYKWIKIINFSTNRGLGVVLKTAIKRSLYPYIARCDADDISTPNRFELQIKFLMKNKNIDVLGSNINEVSNYNLISKKKVHEFHQSICNNIFYRNPINHSSVIFKKKTILDSGNYENVQYFEDYFLWIKVFLKGGKFHNLQEYLVNMNVDNNFFKRRSGLNYLKFYYNFVKILKYRNIITWKIFLFNLMVRTSVILMPILIIKKMYKFFLRS